jgi:hypothetical protein
MNPASGTISGAGPGHALADSMEARETRLKNNKLPLSAAQHRAIRNFTSQEYWPLISANSLIHPRAYVCKVVSLLVQWEKTSDLIHRLQANAFLSRESSVFLSARSNLQ